MSEILHLVREFHKIGTHGDLTAGNILINNKGIIVLSDLEHTKFVRLGETLSKEESNDDYAALFAEFGDDEGTWDLPQGNEEASRVFLNSLDKATDETIEGMFIIVILCNATNSIRAMEICKIKLVA